jgi:L-iditol 2-dehydrogenase
MTLMKALVSQGEGRFALSDILPPRLAEGDILLRVEACGVCHSDIHKILYRRLDQPSVLGHEIAGRVAQAGGRVTRFKVGDRVVIAHHVPCLTCHYCRHGNFSMCPQFKATGLDPGGFSEFVRVPETHVNRVAFRIPDNLTSQEACFMEPLACCTRNIKRLNLQKGDTAIVVGLGSIGLLLGQLVRLAGALPIGVDLDPARRETARGFGFDWTFSGQEPEFKKTLSDLTGGRGADAVVITAGGPKLVPVAAGWLRDGGTLNLFASFHPESEGAFDWNTLYYREINVVTTYSPSPADLSEALGLLADRTVRVAAMAKDFFPLEKFSDALQALQNKTILKAIMVPHANGG